MLRRFYSSLRHSKRLGATKKRPEQPLKPARTRFAPSPTGFLHLGSLRTALYNYLLAKSTNGQFLLRLEDTDQKRLVEGAEQNIYDSLKWCGLNWDEGPVVGGKFGPYRQSDRSKIYAKYIQTLLDNGSAYRCFCPKHRLDALRESAQKLVPPTTVTYDRECSNISSEESIKRSKSEPFTIRFKSPTHYPKFTDLLHGELDLQPQINKDDIRYDDQVLIKSDGLPTYHFANVVDDHLMEITHVVRGEEWLASTPKHIALYKAFGWNAPSFIHIPLLTGSKDKKLSKRSGDIDVINFGKNGILPEALVNFVALFGWSIPKELNLNSEVLKLKDLEKNFTIHDLTKGNAKVDQKKLQFFNKIYLHERIENNDKEIIDKSTEILSNFNLSNEKIIEFLHLIKFHLTTINEITDFDYLLRPIDFQEDENIEKFLTNSNLNLTLTILNNFNNSDALKDIDSLINSLDYPKKEIFGSLRFALTGNKQGLKIPSIIEFLGYDESISRINEGIKFINEKTCT